METTEKIVEAYVRYVKGWATIPNLKVGLKEIDLLAINPKDGSKYHIESYVSISSGFRKITNKKFSGERLKLKKAEQRSTLGFYIECKFGDSEVNRTLHKYGFDKNKYQKVIVAWDFTSDAEQRAARENIELWRFPELIREITRHFEGVKTYFIDDTLRTLHLYNMAVDKK